MDKIILKRMTDLYLLFCKPVILPKGETVDYVWQDKLAENKYKNCVKILAHNQMLKINVKEA